VAAPPACLATPLSLSRISALHYCSMCMCSRCMHGSGLRSSAARDLPFALGPFPFTCVLATPANHRPQRARARTSVVLTRPTITLFFEGRPTITFTHRASVPRPFPFASVSLTSLGPSLFAMIYYNS